MLNSAINLDKINVSPGEQISGTVSLITRKNNDKVTLTILGLEQIKYHYKISSKSLIGRPKLKIKIGEDKMEIMKHQITLGRTLKPGQYSFPFSFIIPSDAPSSIDFLDGSQSGSIRYSIIMESKEEVVEQYILVSEDDNKHMNSLKAAKGSNNMKSCICFNKGFIEVKTTFAESKRTCYYPGEMIKMFATVDNTHSKLDVKELKGIIKLIIVLSGSKGTGKIKKDCTSFTLKKRIKSGEMMTNLPIEFILSAPEGISTSTGNFITSTFSLHLSAIMDGSMQCGMNLPTFTHAIVFAREKRESHYTSLTKNWNPTIKQQKNIHIEMHKDFLPAVIKIKKMNEDARGLMNSENQKRNNNSSFMDSSSLNMVHPSNPTQSIKMRNDRR